MTRAFGHGPDPANGHLGSALWRDWLAGRLAAGVTGAAGDGGGLGATRELQRALTADPPPAAGDPSSVIGALAVVPFAATEVGATWAEQRVAECADAATREVFLAAWTRLQTPGTSVVITGQQPGFLGGPLYTLYKAATTVALAEQRTRAGCPTVPVFWCGDDDDDLSEALAPWCWDPVHGRLWGHASRQRARRQRADRLTVGRLGCAQWSGESLAWLEDLAAAAGGRGTAAGLVARLTDLWQRAVTEDWSWTRLNRHLLTGLLGDRGLLVVAGSDRELHVATTPLYERILAAGPELATLVRDRGRHLETAGYHVQLNDRSLQRPLFRLQDGQRRPLDDGWPTEFTDDLRPGVMLRALIQDWLFEPAAVVVGPGEVAYLRQLDGLYAELDVPRAPLVPRLLAQLVPTGDLDLVLPEVPPREAREDLARTQAQAVVSVGRERLERTLEQDYGLDRRRAVALAEQRTARWLPGLQKMLAAEGRTQAQRLLNDLPAWMAPHGQRQERSLALVGVLAWQGEELLEAVLAAAHEHLDQGRSGRWPELRLEIDA